MKKTITMAAATLALAAGTQAATVIHSLGVDGEKDSGDSVLVTAWNGTLTGLSGTVGTEAFTYDIALSGAGTATSTVLSGLNNEDVVNVVVTVTSGNAQFDGFTYIGTAKTANAEGMTVNGFTYTRAGVGIQNGTSLDTADSGAVTPFPVTATAFTTVAGNGIDLATLEFQFSDSVAVPEPSSTALLGLGGLALILRRRK
jgi:hypothetical protein